MTVWKQERPSWCPHGDCQFKRRVMDGMCAGNLPEPAPHEDDFNTYRFCLNGAADNGGIFDLQVNNTDLWWFRWLFDALDGKNTANMSNYCCNKCGYCGPTGPRHEGCNYDAVLSQ